MERIVLQGTPYELGLQHGKSLHDKIHQTIGLYQQLWQLPNDSLPGSIAGYKKVVSSYYPHLAEEIKGIASGAHISEAAIYALNARTELLPQGIMQECTSIGVKGGNIIIAQNWDWMNQFRGLQSIVEIHQPHKPTITQFTESGMVGKIGMNAKGVGVCLNFLPSPRVNPSGLPIPVLLRAVLEARSAEEAASIIIGLPRAASAHYLIGDPHDIISLETTTGFVRAVRKEVITHTNTYAYFGEHCPRKEQCDSYLTHFELTQKTILGALASVRFPRAQLGEVETLQTILINLTSRKMIVAQ